MSTSRGKAQFDNGIELLGLKTLDAVLATMRDRATNVRVRADYRMVRRAG